MIENSKCVRNGVCLSACLSVCLSVCLPVSLLVSQDHLINNAAVGDFLCPCDHKLVDVNINAKFNVFEDKTLAPTFRRDNFGNLRRAVSYLKLPNTTQGDTI